MDNEIEKLFKLLQSANSYSYIVCLSDRFFNFLKLVAHDNIDEKIYSRIISLNDYERNHLYEQEGKILYINDIYAELPVHYKMDDDIYINYACPRNDYNQDLSLLTSFHPIYDVEPHELLYGEALTELSSKFDRATKYDYLSKLFESRVKNTLNINNIIDLTDVINNIRNAKSDQEVYNIVISFLNQFKEVTTMEVYKKFDHVINNILNDYIRMIGKDLNAIKCAYIYDYRNILNKCGSMDSVYQFFTDELNYLIDNTKLDVEKMIPVAHLSWYYKNNDLINRKNKAH